MSKKYDTKSYKIIIILIAVLISPVKGNAQTKNNKITSNKQIIKNPTLKQTNNNKVTSNKQIIKNPTLKQKQITNIRKPQAPQLSNPKQLPITTKDLEKKLLVANTGLAKANKTVKDLEKKLLAANAQLEKANKAVAEKDGEIIKLNQDMNYLLDDLDDLDENLIFQEDTSKKYKKLINCYRAALFTWHDMNSKKGLTEHDHLVINVELRSALFSCPPM